MTTPRQRGRWGRTWHNLANFNIVSLFERPPPPKTPRTIYVQEALPLDFYNVKKNGKKIIKKEHVYTTNQVITSKYTVLTFVPRNLLEQFRRVANIFFLGIDILQFFPKFATISPGLVILPLLVIILLTAAKDGYEDVKRHQADGAINHAEVEVLDGGGFANPNVMGPKSRTFTPGIPKALRRKKRLRSDVDEGAPANQITGEEKERPSGAPVDIEHAMHVQLPPVAISPPLSETTAAPDSPRIGRQPTRRFVRNANGQTTTSGARPDDDNEPRWLVTLWEDLKVGDFVRLRCDEQVPADIVLCATSEPENVAYVETKNLDGETNLKSRNAVPELTHLRSGHAILANRGASGSFRIRAEAPDVNMYKFNASVVLQQEDDEKAHPIDLQTTLLRGTVLRNTDWAIGVVIFTGGDSKIVLNSGNTPSKRSRVERQMNPMVLINLALLCLMAVVCGIVDSVLEKRDYPGALWLYDDNRSGDNPSINGVITFLNAFITFQNVIPISLYVSIEFVRTAQAAFIYFDPDIMYIKPGQKEEDGKPTLARSWNLADDLGQIEYIFSDKTGTLTQNSMEFRQCSVGGVLYHGQRDIRPEAPKSPFANSRSVSSDDTAAFTQQLKPAVQGTFVPQAADATVTLPRIKLSEGVITHFVDPNITADIKNADGNGDAQAQLLDEFFTCLGLCHSVLASVDVEGAVSYKAQSPDEAALVQAAADTGYIFLGRELGSQVLRIQKPHVAEPKRYELLNLLDFTSARKRMSVILRTLDDEDGHERILLLCKGADNVIFERLAPRIGDTFKEKTSEDLETFAGEGLRTLCLAQRYLSEEEYSSWNAEYRNAQIQLENRDEHIENVSNRIEQHLSLLGATAIEDKLQDGVPETIADLKRAGIKVWVATGDKLETAIAIGYSTNLISRQSNLIVVRGSGNKTPYEQLVASAERFFSRSGVLDRDDVHPRDPDAAFARMEGRRDERLPRINTGLSSLVGDDNGQRAGGFVLVIDGDALQAAYEEDYSQELLLQVSTRCEAVICCRVSPLQKALIVRLVKNRLGAMTLAIGDGANDVSMIQAADVGVGISGEEGLQAVNSSDYAIAQFRFLKRLLLVHGQWTYARNSNMIVNFFYKNIVGVGVLWWFQIYCAWSTTYVFEYTYLLFWNVFWSLAPVIAIGIFDRNIDSVALMAIPELYRYGREGLWFGVMPFCIYMMEGVYQSAAVFFPLLYSYNTISSRKDGYDVYMYEFSTTMVIAAVLVVNAFHGISTSAWTGWVWFAVTIGVILIWIYTAVYSAIPPSAFAVPVYGNDHYLFRSAYYWFGIFLTFFIAMLPRYVAKAYRVLHTPNDIDILRIVHKQRPEIDLEHDPLLGGRWTSDGVLKPYEEINRTTSRHRRRKQASRAEEDLYPMQQRPPPRPNLSGNVGSRTDMSTGLPMTDRGFDFSTEEGGVAIRRIQTNLSEHHGPAPRKSGSRLRASRLIPSTLRRSLHSKRPPIPSQSGGE